MSDASLPLHRRRPSWVTLLIPAGVLALLTFAVYWPALHGPLVFDDPSILSGPQSTLGRILEDPASLLQSQRPLTDLSYVAGHLIHGPSLWGHHVVSLLFHVIAGLALMDLLRRTLAAPYWEDRWADVATPLAAVIAGLWMLHPLQTQAVAYLSQRSEVLAMGMIFLSLDALAMSAGAGRARQLILGVSLLACVGAMLSKQIGYVTPLLLVMYDRAFWAGSLTGALRRRPTYYTLAALTLVIPWLLGLGQFLWVAGNATGDGQAVSAGLGMHGTPAWLYLLSQPTVLVHYLRLAIWPDPLVLDYRLGLMEPAIFTAWPDGAALGVTLGIVVALGIVTLAALWRRKAGGFAGLWCFALLAPTSSVIPLADLVMEHRMYGPLAAVLAVIVLIPAWLLTRPGPRKPHLANLSGRTGLALLVIACIIMAALAMTTAKRASDYADPARLWKKTLDHRPANTRAMLALGKLLEDRQPMEALSLYRQAARLEPTNYEPMINLGSFFLMHHQPDEAQRWYDVSYRLSGDKPTYLLNQGLLAEARQDYARAVDWLTQAVALQPDDPAKLSNLGMAMDQLAMQRQRQGEPAVAYGLRLEAHSLLAKAHRLSPQSDAARINLATVQAHLGLQRMHQGDAVGARQWLERSLDTQLRARTLQQLAWLLATWPGLDDTDRHEALRVAQLAWQRRHAQESPIVYLDTLAAAQAGLGQYDQAVHTQQQAIHEADARDADPSLRDELRKRLALYQAHRPYVQEVTPQPQADPGPSVQP